MPTISGIVTDLAANAVSGEQLDENTYQTLPFKALVQIGMVADADGINATFSAGGITMMEDDPIRTTSGDLFPTIPDDFIVAEILPAGTRLNLRFRETAGEASTDIAWVVKITPA